MHVQDLFAGLWDDDAGVSSVEYAFLLAVLTLAVVVAFANMSGEVGTAANQASDTLEDTSGIGCSSG